MEKVKLSKNKKFILNQLKDHSCPSPVPEKDVMDFLELEDMGFVSHLKLDQGSVEELHGPYLADAGERYLVENPRLKNPKMRVASKWWIGTIIALAGAGASILALFKK